MIVIRWNFEKEDFEQHQIPNDWNVVTHSDNMNEIINCACCGKKTIYGSSYESCEIVNTENKGYCICERCNKKEFLRYCDKEGIPNGKMRKRR